MRGLAAIPLILGFNFPAWWQDAYSAPETRASLALMAGTGARHFAVIPTWYLASKDADRLQATEKTASEDSLRSVLRAGRALGLKPVLKPHVDVLDGSPRALIRPRDPRAFFASYRGMLLSCARLAREEGVELLVIGTELFTMTLPPHQAEWEALIREVRAVYPGPLTYAANFYDFGQVPFWGSLDLIGIDGYFPLAGGSDKTLLKASWRAYLPAIRAVSRRHGLPVLFTEIGVASQRGASLQPWNWKDRAPLDLALQQAYFEAFLETFDGLDYFAGFLQWGWEISPGAGGPADKSMTVQGKPAQRTLEGYFRRRAPPPVGPLVRASVDRALEAVEREARFGL